MPSLAKCLPSEPLSVFPGWAVSFKDRDSALFAWSWGPAQASAMLALSTRLMNTGVTCGRRLSAGQR